MLTVVASYRQNVHAYPSGGGDYEVATVNLGPTAGVTVASALLVDYVLTVAVSISSGVQNAALGAVVRVRATRRCGPSVLVLVLAALNLRGVRESGHVLRHPDLRLHGRRPRHGGLGAFRAARRDAARRRERPAHDRRRPRATRAQITTVALVFLLARAFSSGCAALTGVEAISNGVPAFRKPKSRNAATTLLLLGDDRGHDAAEHHRAWPGRWT